MAFKYDFAGWATKSGIKCTDGRTIMPGAFKHNDGQRVTVVYMHNHDDITNVLGHAVLEDRKQGTYAYVSLNETERGKIAKQAVAHGDITALSIFANELQERNGAVYHGNIKEVSLVIAGANKGAVIDRPIIHYEDGSWEYDENAPEDEFVFLMPSTGETLSHSGILEGYDEYGYPEMAEEEPVIEHADKDDEESEERGKKVSNKSLEEILNSLPEDERNIVYASYAYVAKNSDQFKDLVDGSDEEGGEASHSDIYENEGEEDMSRYNLYENNIVSSDVNTLSHADWEQLQKESIADVKNFGGSLKDSFIAHAANYGIESIDMLFPEAQKINGTEPEILNYDQEWVSTVMNGVSHSPFTRVKMEYADITEKEARAKGYTKGDRKEEEVIALLRRELRPTTILSKQKLDREDILEITTFDVVAFVKRIGRMKLDEESARAILFGDGRSPVDRQKIKEDCIVPIIKEDPLFAIRYPVSTGVADANHTADDNTALNIIRAAIKSRKGYKGSGNPTLFTTEDILSDMLLLTDKDGHDLYESQAKLETKMRVSKIVTIPDEVFPANDIYGVIVNMRDYRVGTNKGGQVTLFSDFDINYNQEIYLQETSFSGGLVKPYSAIILKKQQ